MGNDTKFNRREFIIEGTGALVGAAALGAGVSPAEAATAQAPGRPARFQSPAGSDIPFAQADLLAQGKPRTFTGEHLSEIAFPIGGIGTGTVSLGGRGQLRDWEIFNRPAKGTTLPFTFVAVWAKAEGTTPVMKVLEAPPGPPFRGGRGYAREDAQGLPHMKDARFTGTYPIAEIAFDDDALPVAVSLEAFNPLVPLATDDSSLPVAIFRYRVTNRSRSPVDVSIAFSIQNAIGHDLPAPVVPPPKATGRNLTRLRRESGLNGLDMTTERYSPEDVRFGSMALVTPHPDVTARSAWESGPWFDSFQKWFDEFATTGRVADSETAGARTAYATLAPYLRLEPGETRPIEFYLTWYFPLREIYWNEGRPGHGEIMRNDYATRFADAWDVARHTVANIERLERGTRAFRDTLFSSTLPAVVVDAVSSQMSIIRTNTCMLLEGKRLFAFEGTNDTTGCCPLNCTHVWNYEQALAHLFPDLERSMRVTDFMFNVRADGSMAFRTLTPTGKAVWDYKPAADGQMGSILKLYREWQMSGDDEFLKRLWPSARRVLEYAWQAWDPDRDGVMEGDQHNTYDIEFYGPNTMMGTLYLGALVAGERMARAVGAEAAAVEYRRVFESGRVKLDLELWRDGYYVQRVPDELPVPDATTARPAATPQVTESGSIKYQYGEGCLSDQLLGQWFAEVVNLGHLLPHDHIRTTLQSIFRHNFKHSFFDHPNTQRIYALNDEKGLVLCSWPRGQRPALPFVYADEVWTGVEYQVAAHLIYEGFVMEGLAIVKGVRDRYDGRRRNPWNEVECGSHYARALASWALLTALSGYSYSAPERRLAFAPRLPDTTFRTLFSTGHGWGTFEQRTATRRTTASVTLAHGELALATLGFPFAGPDPKATARHGPRAVPVQWLSGAATFGQPLTLNAGETLTVDVQN